MKNSILINIDTEREQPVVFGKPPEVPQPQNKEEAGVMILNDIVCVTEALRTLIVMASLNGYGDKTELVDAAVKTINTALDVTAKKESENESETTS